MTNAPFKPNKKRSVPESVSKDVAAEISAATPEQIDLLSRSQWGSESDEMSHIPDESTQGVDFSKMLKRPQTLMVQIERIYGGVTYRFGIAETIEVSPYGAEKRSAYDELTAQVTAQHDHFVNETLPRQPGFLHKEQEYKPENKPNSQATEYLKYSAVSLIKEKNKYDKTMYKIITSSGRYSQYGIVVWPEFLKDAGLWDEIQRVDIYPLNNLTLTVKEGGKYPTVERLATTTNEDVFTSNERDIPF